MAIESATSRMTSEEIVAQNRKNTFFSWSVQGQLDPIAIDRAEGVYLYTPEGKRILDFNSQLMSVNIGHGDRRVIDAITEQAMKLQYVQPAFAERLDGHAASRRERPTWARRRVDAPDGQTGLVGLVPRPSGV